MPQSLAIMRARFAIATSGAGSNVNAATPDPKEVVFSTSSPADYNLDMGASIAADAFFAGFLSANSDLAVEVFTTTTLGGGTIASRGTLVLGPATATRRHGFLKLGATVSSRFWRFRLSGTGNLQAGVLTIGDAIQPAWGHEWGSGRFIDDRSAVEPLRGGGFGVERAARVPGWQFTVSELDDTELSDLWDLVEEVGKSAPVVVVEDPSLASANLNRALHYGLFDRPEAYARESPGQNRWSFRVVGWV